MNPEERIAELRPKTAKLYETIALARRELAYYEAQIMQLTMIGIADEYPQITSFSFEAEFEYDDEGGYFWAPTFYSTPDLTDEDDWSVSEGIRDAGADEDQVTLAFMSTSTSEGKISVVALRALYDENLQFRIPDSGSSQPKGESDGLS